MGTGLLFVFLFALAASLAALGTLRVLVRPGRVALPCGRRDSPRTVTLAELRRGDAVVICSCSVRTCIMATDLFGDGVFTRGGVQEITSVQVDETAPEPDGGVPSL